MYKSDLLKKNSRFNQGKDPTSYDKTTSPRIDKKKFSVYKIYEEPKSFPHILLPYVDQNYWDNYYTDEEPV